MSSCHAIIGSDNGLSPVQCQATIWTNAVLLSIGPVGTNFSQNVFKIQTFSFKKMHLNQCFIIVNWTNRRSTLQSNCIQNFHSRKCIWTNTVLLSIGPIGTNFSQIICKIQTFSFKKMHLKISPEKCWPFCLSLNGLTTSRLVLTQGHDGTSSHYISNSFYYHGLTLIPAWISNHMPNKV